MRFNIFKVSYFGGDHHEDYFISVMADDEESVALLVDEMNKEYEYFIDDDDQYDKFEYYPVVDDVDIMNTPEEKLLEMAKSLIGKM